MQPQSNVPRSRRRGTSLVEILVVLVVLLIGILAMLRIFPGGLRILAWNRTATMATALARGQMALVTGRTDRLPEAIYPVGYQYVEDPLPRIATYDDRNRTPNELGPFPGNLNQNGVISDTDGHNLGDWPLLSGPNLFRRVIGEGGRVPAPRQVGNFYGGLAILQFTPIIFNAQDPGRFVIYGADLLRREGEPADGEPPLTYEYFIRDVDQSTATLILPADTALSRTYRLAVSFYTDVAGDTKKRDVVDRIITVPPQASGEYELPLATGDLPTNAPLITGEPFQSAELESIRVARRYEPIPLASNFDDPYQFKLLDENLGLVLFSERAYNTFELRGGKRVPLQARFNYDVYDWRVIRDEFRVPNGDIPQAKLSLGNLKTKGNQDVDGRTYQGLNFNVQNGLGSSDRRDMVFMDLDTGGILLELSASRLDAGSPKRLLRYDRSLGLVTFIDADDNPANGIQGEMVLPQQTVAVDVTLTGRALRAMYQANNEWAVHVMKAPAVFTPSSLQPGIAEYYVGASDAGVGGNPTRIYFPRSVAGQRVTIDEVWYRRPADAAPRLLENQSFVVQTLPADALGFAYVDILTADNQADAFDFDTYGYSVRGVRGASVVVRVLWNPSYLTLSSDTTSNIQNLEVWARDWRRSTTETFLRREAE